MAHEHSGPTAEVSAEDADCSQEDSSADSAQEAIGPDSQYDTSADSSPEAVGSVEDVVGHPRSRSRSRSPTRGFRLTPALLELLGSLEDAGMVERRQEPRGILVSDLHQIEAVGLHEPLIEAFGSDRSTDEEIGSQSSTTATCEDTPVRSVDTSFVSDGDVYDEVGSDAHDSDVHISPEERIVESDNEFFGPVLGFQTDVTSAQGCLDLLEQGYDLTVEQMHLVID